MLLRKFYGPHKNWVAPPVTAQGYFATTNSGTAMNVYDFTNKTMALSIGQTPIAGAGATSQGCAGNSEFGLWMRGGGTNQTFKYRYANNVVESGTNMTSVFNTSNGIGCGNDVVGLFNSAAGGANRNTMKYTFASNTVSAGGLLTVVPGNRGPADGNLEKAIITLSNSTNNTNKYTYASDTAVLGGTLGQSHSGGTDASISNADLVIFTLNLITHRYVLATDTAANSTFLTTQCTTYKGVSDGTTGLFAMGLSSGGGIKTSNEWTFAANSVVVGTEFQTNVASASCNGASSLNPGVNSPL